MSDLRHLALLLPMGNLLLLAAMGQAQSPTAAPPVSTLNVGTQLVVVDVVVQDASGHPVHGLQAANFKVSEGSTPQAVHTFEEHSRQTDAATGPQMPKLPPGTFTNYTPVAPDSTLNVLLLDSLNTPTKDQSYVRYQLQQYVKHADPHARIAIFGLANRLILLQGFSSDPETLKDAVEHKLIPRASSLLDDPTGSNVDVPSMSDMIADSGAPGQSEVAANVAQFEAQTAAMETQFRLQFTLDAFHTLARYLSAFSGRKNVIWFSGSFPIDILPDATLQDPFAVVQVNEDEFRETTSLLAKAQVAVYPVDARGLMTAPMFDAANSGRGYVRNPQKFSQDLSKFSTSQAQEHATMEQMAFDTGGHAFYNTNGLAEAVTKAMEAGANYYTLTYIPTDKREDGAYHNIRVELTGAEAKANLQLSYRHGYYASTPPRKRDEVATAANPLQQSRTAYANAAMARGAPTPEDILMKVRVLPASTATEDTLAPGNVADPNYRVAGPYKRYDVDFVALASELILLPQPDGSHDGQVEFLAYVYDGDGRLLNAVERGVALKIPAVNYPQFQHSPINFHLEVSAPARQETYLRIGIRDIPSNRFGVVEVPSSTVSHLPPAVYPAKGPATAAPAASTPSTSTPPPPPQH